MHFSKLDAFFHVASQGSREAYQYLYSEFIYRAKIKINQLVNNNLKFTGFSEDFHQYLDELFLDALNDFDGTKGSFTYFIDYVLNLRLPPKVAVEMRKRYKICQLKNENGEYMDIECLEDPNQNSISKDIAIEEFKYRISSPNRNSSNYDRLQNKIAMMKYAGYTKAEILEKLRISDTLFRRCLKQIQNNKDNIDFKLELK